MKLLKISQCTRLLSAENAAAIQRLNTIVSRGQAELSEYQANLASIPSVGVQQRFWSPE